MPRNPSAVPDLPLVGLREWIGLPELTDHPIKAKTDTGARTSALHALEQKLVDRNGAAWVRFRLFEHSDAWCEARLVGERSVKNSGGQQESRYAIETPARLGSNSFVLELTLTDRRSMAYRMLLGRRALNGRFLVNPARSFIASRATHTRLRHR
ncbi:MAG: RimK/LysX family protein [Pseudomonadota bacterium]